MAHTLYLSEDDLVELLIDKGGPMTVEEFHEACKEANDPDNTFERIAYVATMRDICHGKFEWIDHAGVFSGAFRLKRDYDRFMKKYVPAAN